MNSSNESIQNKLVGIILGLGMTVGAAVAGGDIFSFVHLPTILMCLVPIPILFFLKYGKEGILFFKQETNLKDQIIKDGYLLSSLLAGVSVVSGLIIMLSNLSDQAAIGPALAISILGLVYSIVLIVFIFYPQSEAPLPSFVIATPIIGTLLVLLTFFILLVSFR